jgi:autotransporter-associated beta strand protein
MASTNSTTTAASIVVTGGTQTISANMALAGSLTIAPTAGSTLTISGSVNESTPGAGVLELTDAGTLVLGGSNEFTGGTVVTSGTLVLTNNEALAAGSSLTIGDASAFQNESGGARSDTGSVSSALNAPLAASPSITPVPEPGTLALVVAGVIAGLTTWRRRHKQSNG